MTRKERIPWYERPYGLDRLVHISTSSTKFNDKDQGVRDLPATGVRRPREEKRAWTRLTSPGPCADKWEMTGVVRRSGGEILTPNVPVGA